ncbi:MAG: DNA alkylation repair protein [Dysgonomonas sp.]|uniref:DNA alkylation repair protein n=1 Tax=Dysgonomonas sp. TaxID=1891233 RepID=UPI0039E72443
MKIQTIQSQLESLSNPEKKVYFPTFFKTGKGQYGEGDLFIGIIVPDIRKVAKANKDITPEEIELLLNNSFHECRMCALMILVEQFKKRKKENERKSIFDFYLSHTSRINNWDLVDLSAKDIVGEYLADKQNRTVLYELAESSLLWDQRIAVIATFAFIKRHDFTDIIKLSEKLLYHKHDLMHKAIGWMLRETGKKSKSVLIGFLDKHHQSMPRTMLRYSIEKLSAEEKSYYMRKI